jgi:hypothetical protein
MKAHDPAKRRATMKKFLAVYMGTGAARSNAQWDNLDASTRKEIEAKGVKAWMEWGTRNAAAIVDGAVSFRGKGASCQRALTTVLC